LCTSAFITFKIAVETRFAMAFRLAASKGVSFSVWRQSHITSEHASARFAEFLSFGLDLLM
jgi:hypothetical protein